MANQGKCLRAELLLDEKKIKRVIAKIKIFIFVDSFAFIMGLLSDLEKNVPRTGVIFCCLRVYLLWIL